MCASQVIVAARTPSEIQPGRYMKERRFFIPREAIKRGVAPGRGGCIATDSITVQGHPVGFMYREDSDKEYDSGWHFFAATDSQEYVDDPDNMAIYDVNTIANYDPDIIPLLDAPYGSAFERQDGVGAFHPTDLPDDPDADAE